MIYIDDISENTFLDSLYDKIYSSKDIGYSELTKFISYISENEYDTNSIQQDINDTISNNSNINNMFKNKLLTHLITDHYHFIAGILYSIFYLSHSYHI